MSDLIQHATNAQNRAAQPETSVWVSANAGTGKTHMLTNRLVRLLVENEQVQPSEILALTFSKAAAQEMSERLDERLQKLAQQDVTTRKQTLETLCGKPLSDTQIERAGTLHDVVLDTPVRCLTLHSFCQQIISQFPLEAGVSFPFRVLEDGEDMRLLLRAQNQVLQRVSDAQHEHHWAFVYAASNVAESTLQEQLKDMTYARRRLLKLARNTLQIQAETPIRQHIETVYGFKPMWAGVLANLAQQLDIQDIFDPIIMQKRVQQPHVLPSEALLQHFRGALPQILEIYGEKSNKLASALVRMCENPTPEHAQNYAQALLTQAGTPVKTLFKKDVFKVCGEDLETALREEQTRILAEKETLKAEKTWLNTAVMLTLGVAVFEKYTQLKSEYSALDYDDLIHHATDILTNSSLSAWVKFKLDAQIQHLLLDEGQDIDPDQKAILDAISEDFFTGIGQQEDTANRTLFAVGDLKQSIYRFRGSTPYVFGEIQSQNLENADKNGAKTDVVELQTSFRSTPAVLSAVDDIFAHPSRAQAADQLANGVSHASVRQGHAGHVEVWELESVITPKPQENWALPQHQTQASTSLNLARKVAQRIQLMLETETIIDRKAEPVVRRKLQAEDIMILLRNRAPANDFMQALKEAKIPFVLDIDPNPQEAAAHPLAMHVKNLLQSFLTPEDDLVFASVLKGAIFNLSDDDLLTLKQSAPVGNFTFVRTCFTHSAYKSVFETWQKHAKMAQNVSIYQFLVQLFAEKRCAAVSDREAQIWQEALLNKALEHGSGIASFIQSLERQGLVLPKLPIKSNGLRILTVHKSKGLEAPVVFLPQTTVSFDPSSQQESKLAWQKEAGKDSLVLYRNTKTEATNLQQELDKQEKDRNFQDEMRLLYVAMTRAEEKLIICGKSSKKPDLSPEKLSERLENPPETLRTWYEHIFQTIVEHPDWQYNFETGVWLKKSVADSLPTVLQPIEVIEENAPEPSWLNQPHAAEMLSQKITAAHAVVASGQTAHNLFRRGRVMHKLLQFVPEIPENQRKSRIEHFLQLHAPDVPNHGQIVQAVLSVLDTYKDFFAANSRAEVPLTLQNEENTFHGIVDRLVIQEQEIWVLDYKTDAYVPSAAAMPETYRQQLQAYKQALQEIFPEKQVKTAIMWVSATQNNQPCPRVDWI